MISKEHASYTFVAIEFILLLAIATSTSIYAHPPENHPKKSVSTPSVGPRETKTVPDQKERQIAYFQFEFLTALAMECASELQPLAIQQALAELHLATEAPQAIPLSQLQEKRLSLHEKLAAIHPVVSCRWSDREVALVDEIDPLEIAEGLSRSLILEVENSEQHAIDVAVIANGQKQNNSPWTILPGKKQMFALTVQADKPTVKVELQVGSVIHDFALAIKQVKPAKIRCKIVDRDSNTPCAARVWIEGSDHQYRHAGPFARNRSFTEKPLLLFSVPRSYRVPFFYANEDFEIVVPPGPTHVTLERGFEHKLVEEPVDLMPGEIRDLTISSGRFVDMKQKGWISGDTHIHWVTNAWNVDLSIDDLAWVQRAEDLRVANNLTLLHRTNIDAFIKPSQAPIGPVNKLSDGEYHIQMGEEYRNQNLYGHLCFLNLKWLVLPIGTGPQIAGDDSLDYPINKSAILQAREQGAISIEAHGVGANHELPLNAVHSLTDSLDQIDPEDYYRLLDCGFQIPLTNGSDHPARVLGCARAYVKIDGPFTYQKWIDGIRRGRTFTTSGPLLELTVNSKEVGDVVIADKNEQINISVKATSRYPLGKVQVVSNGEVLKEIETDKSGALLEFALPADESRWIVARCSRGDQWNAIWEKDVAHTSAIYVHVDHQSVFREGAAREWIDRMRFHIRDIQMKGVFSNLNQRTEAIEYTEESIRRYERLIDRRATRGVSNANPDEKVRDLLLLAPFAASQVLEMQYPSSIDPTADPEKIVKSLEPYVLLRIKIDEKSDIAVEPQLTMNDLQQDRTYRYLLEIQNNAGYSEKLKLEAIQNIATRSGNRGGCEIQIVENLLSSAKLSGARSEWKLIELRWSEAGDYEIRASIDSNSSKAQDSWQVSFPRTK